MTVYLIGHWNISPRSDREVVYHSWSGCLGIWRPARAIELHTLDYIVGIGNTIPCRRCLHGRRP